MRLKGQNAVEFIFTYSIVITIITVAVALVLIFANAGRSIIPSQCSFFGGFACTYAAYSVNSANPSTSQLLIIASDTQPGVVNVTSFNAIIGSITSTSGSCTPGVVISGQSVHCIATFNIKAAVGTVYTGTFTISANYCAQNATNSKILICKGNSNFTYGGSLQTQAINGSKGFILSTVSSTSVSSTSISSTSSV